MSGSIKLIDSRLQDFCSGSLLPLSSSRRTDPSQHLYSLSYSRTSTYTGPRRTAESKGRVSADFSRGGGRVEAPDSLRNRRRGWYWEGGALGAGCRLLKAPERTGLRFKGLGGVATRMIDKSPGTSTSSELILPRLVPQTLLHPLRVVIQDVGRRRTP